jgi:hypothetical protein
MRGAMHHRNENIMNASESMAMKNANQHVQAAARHIQDVCREIAPWAEVPLCFFATHCQVLLNAYP